MRDHLIDFINLSNLVTESRIKRIPAIKNTSNPIKMSMLLFPILFALDFYVTGASIAFSNIDNKPTVEFTNELFTKASKIDGKTFPHIDLVHGTVDILVGIDGKKMSKSNNNCIFFSDNAEDLKRKINKMYTDSHHIYPYSNGCITNNIVFKFLKAFLPYDEFESIAFKYENGLLSDSESKGILFDLLFPFLFDCQEKSKLLSDSIINKLIKV